MGDVVDLVDLRGSPFKFAKRKESARGQKIEIHVAIANASRVAIITDMVKNERIIQAWICGSYLVPAATTTVHSWVLKRKSGGVWARQRKQDLQFSRLRFHPKDTDNNACPSTA